MTFGGPPQHEQAVNRAAEAIVDKIDTGFDVQEKPRGPMRSSTP
jgi:hypothetical protein